MEEVKLNPKFPQERILVCKSTGDEKEARMALSGCFAKRPGLLTSFFKAKKGLLRSRNTWSQDARRIYMDVSGIRANVCHRGTAHHRSMV